MKNQAEHSIDEVIQKGNEIHQTPLKESSIVISDKDIKIIEDTKEQPKVRDYMRGIGGLGGRWKNI